MQDQPNKLHLCSVFTRDLQRNRTSSIYTGIKKEVLLELSHKIKEDEKSHDLFSANWRTSNAGGIIQYDFKGPCFSGASDGKASACNADLGSIPGSGRYPGEGNGNPLQYSCLENSTDGGAWWATVNGVAKSQIQLSDFTSNYDI